MGDDLAALAAEAYVYGFPLVFNVQMLGGGVDVGLVKPGPLNSFSHAALPAPAALFRPIMRLYQPQAAVLDGTYKIPPITKAAN